MSDEKDKEDESQEGPVGGERLRAARRENNISVRDVAKELHLDEPKVRALERNEFDVLGAPVFAKGHLRKYAELVGVSIDDVITDYYQMNRAVGAPPVVGPKRPPQPREINPGPWIGGVLLVIAIAGALYWWFALRTPEAPSSVAAPVTVIPVNESPAEESRVDDSPVDPEGEDAATEVVSESAVETIDETAPEPEAPAAEVAATEVPETTSTEVENAVAPPENYQPTPGVPQVALDLAFTGECWTEVSDAGGRRLFYDLGTDGRVVNLSGDAPLRVILGDSENVEVFVDGDPWPIPASSRSGRLARLTINPR